MENQIIQGDCLEVLKNVPNESVNLVLTDPPYGDNITYGRKEKEILNNEDESINYKIIPLLYDKLIEGGVCYLFTNWKFYPKLHLFIEKNTNFNIRMMLVIVKNNFGMGYGFRNQHELCFVLEKGKHTYNGNDLSNVLQMQHIHHDDNSHPHEKGIDLLKRLINHSSEEGDLVLDCFAGSGSTLVACKETKRNFIGIELDKKWVDLSKERLSKMTQQLF